MPIEIPEHVLRESPWSISKAKVIAECSLHYDYQYIQKLKKISEYEATLLGKAAHLVLELVLRDGLSIKDAFMHATDQFTLTENELEKLGAFHEAIANFVQWVGNFKTKERVQRVFTEVKWGVDSAFNATPFFDVRNAPVKKVFFRGALDYAMLTARNDLVIVDHKTGHPKTLERYHDQIHAYAILALANIKGLRGVQAQINHTVDGSQVWSPYIPVTEIRDSYQPWLLQFLNTSCEKLLKPAAATLNALCFGRCH